MYTSASELDSCTVKNTTLIVSPEKSVLYQPLATDDVVVATDRARWNLRKALRRSCLKAALALLFGSFVGLHLVCRFGLLRLDGVCSTHVLGCHKQREHVGAKTSMLPTHYALPSGDKIPSVALGTAAVNIAVEIGILNITC